MRILGVETSSRRATVALVENARVIGACASEVPLSGEKVLPLVEALLAEAGWSRAQLDRIAVGVGPGSFTGMRVGVALAQGFGLGLGRPVLGVSSPRAMCRGVPSSVRGVRGALLDARRNECFVGVYDEAGTELLAPCAVPRDALPAFLAALPQRPAVLVGEVLAELPDLGAMFRSPETDLPHAAPVALAGEELAEAAAPPEPQYVRPADAIRPNLPRSPLSSGGSE